LFPTFPGDGRGLQARRGLLREAGTNYFAANCAQLQSVGADPFRIHAAARVRRFRGEERPAMDEAFANTVKRIFGVVTSRPAIGPRHPRCSGGLRRRQFRKVQPQ